MRTQVRLFGSRTTLLVTLFAASPVFAQHGAVDGEWRSYNGDIGRLRDVHDGL